MRFPAYLILGDGATMDDMEPWRLCASALVGKMGEVGCEVVGDQSWDILRSPDMMIVVLENEAVLFRYLVGLKRLKVEGGMVVGDLRR